MVLWWVNFLIFTTLSKADTQKWEISPRDRLKSQHSLYENEIKNSFSEAELLVQNWWLLIFQVKSSVAREPKDQQRLFCVFTEFGQNTINFVDKDEQLLIKYYQF